jgi:hypothetical protein
MPKNYVPKNWTPSPHNDVVATPIRAEVLAALSLETGLLWENGRKPHMWCVSLRMFLMLDLTSETPCLMYTDRRPEDIPVRRVTGDTFVKLAEDACPQHDGTD